MASWWMVLLGIVMIFGVITHNILYDNEIEPALDDKLEMSDLVKVIVFLFGFIIIVIAFFYRKSGSKNNPTRNES